MKQFTLFAALLAVLAVAGTPAHAALLLSHAVKPAVVKAAVKAAPAVVKAASVKLAASACCADGACCANSNCCTMPGCCQPGGACCDAQRGVCTSACGCPDMTCCAK